MLVVLPIHPGGPCYVRIAPAHARQPRARQPRALPTSHVCATSLRLTHRLYMRAGIWTSLWRPTRRLPRSLRIAVAAVLLVVAAVTMITQRRRRGSDPPVVAPAPVVGYCTLCGAELYECQICGDTVHACNCEPTYCSCDAPRPPPAPPAACIPRRVAAAASRGGASMLMATLLSAAALCLACRGGGGSGGAVRVGVLVKAGGAIVLSKQE